MSQKIGFDSKLAKSRLKPTDHNPLIEASPPGSCFFNQPRETDMAGGVALWFKVDSKI